MSDILRRILAPAPRKLNETYFSGPPTFFVPFTARARVAEDARFGLIRVIASKYPLTRVIQRDESGQLFDCFEAQIAGGVVLGFVFKDPRTRLVEGTGRFLCLEYLWRSKNGADALKAARSFVRFIEAQGSLAPELIFFKYGELRSDLIGNRSTVPEGRLRPVYHRFFRPRAIEETEYFSISFRHEETQSTHSNAIK